VYNYARIQLISDLAFSDLFVYHTSVLGAVQCPQKTSAVRGARVVQCRHFVDKEGSLDVDVRTLHFLVQKYSGFFKLYGVSLWTRREGVI